MFQKTEPLENLVDQFARFPGIGRKSAVRMAYQVMSMPAEQAMELAQAIEHAKKDLHRCRICQDFTTGDVCKICASQKRDRSVICVVESPATSRPSSVPMSIMVCTMYCTAQSRPWTVSVPISSASRSCWPA